MYLVVPQLKNRQTEIEHGCFLAIGRRPRDFSKLSRKEKEQHSSAQTQPRSKREWKYL